MTTYTFTWAKWKDFAHTVVEATSVEFGTIMFTQLDNPDAWDQLMDQQNNGLVIEEYEALPPPPVNYINMVDLSGNVTGQYTMIVVQDSNGNKTINLKEITP